MSGPRIAILMTCFNRRDLTLACLRNLRNQARFRECDLFLVDDGSSDGTGDAVRELMPAANVLQGDGSLFWNGGMRMAWQAAKSSPVAYDYYLWLNDDVTLFDHALDMLVEDAQRCAGDQGAVIVAGATLDPDTRQVTYGAHLVPDRTRPLRMSLVAPAGHPVPADSICGNIVLVSAAAEEILGNLSPRFEHIYGDLDYGFRAKAAGVPTYLASRAAGECAANTMAGGSLAPGIGKIERLRRRLKEENKIHARDWRRFVAMYGGGGLAPLKHRLAPYLRIIAGRPNTHASRVLDPN